MAAEIITTKDGSHTLYVPDLHEYYHSVYGAIQESQHVYIKAGLEAVKQEQINILEVGFGTGLNALLTFFHARLAGTVIHYHAYEPFPLPAEIWQKLNYDTLTKGLQDTTLFHRIHQSPCKTTVSLSSGFNFIKLYEKIEHAELPGNFFDLIYFDAFAPAVQPELWTIHVFKKLFEATAVNGILVTYSAMGEVRRNLKKAGYAVERLAGPPGKREMLRAQKVILEC